MEGGQHEHIRLGIARSQLGLIDFTVQVDAFAHAMHGDGRTQGPGRVCIAVQAAHTVQGPGAVLQAAERFDQHFMAFARRDGCHAQQRQAVE